MQYTETKAHEPGEQETQDTLPISQGWLLYTQGTFYKSHLPPLLHTVHCMYLNVLLFTGICVTSNVCVTHDARRAALAPGGKQLSALFSGATGSCISTASDCCSSVAQAPCPLAIVLFPSSLRQAGIALAGSPSPVLCLYAVQQVSLWTGRCCDYETDLD